MIEGKPAEEKSEFQRVEARDAVAAAISTPVGRELLARSSTIAALCRLVGLSTEATVVEEPTVS